MSPALAGGFLTTEPIGKSPRIQPTGYFFLKKFQCVWLVWNLMMASHFGKCMLSGN